MRGRSCTPGRVSVNVLPLPGSLVTLTRPPCASAIRMHEVQAEAAALDLLRDRLAAAIERLEDVLAVLGIDADAAIFDGEDHRIALS